MYYFFLKTSGDNVSAMGAVNLVQARVVLAGLVNKDLGWP